MILSLVDNKKNSSEIGSINNILPKNSGPGNGNSNDEQRNRNNNG